MIGSGPFSFEETIDKFQEIFCCLLQQFSDCAYQFFFFPQLDRLQMIVYNGLKCYHVFSACKLMERMR